MDTPLPFESYRGSNTEDWPAIAKSREDARGKRKALAEHLSQFETADLSVVLFGSLAREEWTSGSDVDWTLLVDGQADGDHYRTAQAIQKQLEEQEFSKPGSSGVFGSLTFSHDLVHYLGGQLDTNINTTRRVLLALESVGLRGDARERTLRAVLKRYLDDDLWFDDPTKSKVPRFLLNDIVRFWRTLCVDYGMKRWTNVDKWALRNVKLRMSRKWLFASGLLMMFACDGIEASDNSPESGKERTMDRLVELSDRTPTDIIVEQLQSLGLVSQLNRLLTIYDEYLKKIDDPAIRDELKHLRVEDSATNEHSNWFKQKGRDFHEMLGEVFLSADDRLTKFTKDYAVF